MKQITQSDLDDLAVGVAILGSGGGGDPSYRRMIAKQQLEKGGPINLLKFSELDSNSIVAPIGFMGAPLVSIERMPSTRQFLSIIPAVEKVYGRKIDALIATEIGGGNAFTPLIVAGKMGIPVVDADTIGRAFPELQHSTCNLFGISASPAVLTDIHGNTRVIIANDAFQIEQQCRLATVEMGSSALLCFYIMNCHEAKKATIPDSFSHGFAIGRSIRQAKESGANPIEALLEYSKGVWLDSGTIIDIEQSISKGFLQGNVLVKTETGIIKISYQNEYLVAFRDETPIISTPDIIAILEIETSTPITSESLAYGLRVAILGLPSPSIWQTEKGLELVGPRSFGYKFDYKPISKRLP